MPFSAVLADGFAFRMPFIKKLAGILIPQSFGDAIDQFFRLINEVINWPFTATVLTL